jgi:hypothetical protein
MEAWGTKLITGQDGKVTLPHQGRATVTARAPGLWGHVEMPVGWRATTLALEPDRELRVRTVRDGGTPQADVFVSVRTAGDFEIWRGVTQGPRAEVGIPHIDWVVRHFLPTEERGVLARRPPYLTVGSPVSVADRVVFELERLPDEVTLVVPSMTPLRLLFETRPDEPYRGPVNLTFGRSPGEPHPIDSLRSATGEPISLLVQDGLRVSVRAYPLARDGEPSLEQRPLEASGVCDAAHATMTLRFGGRLQSFRGRLTNPDGSPHVTAKVDLAITWQDRWEYTVDAEKRVVVASDGQFEFTCWLPESAWNGQPREDVLHVRDQNGTRPLVSSPIKFTTGPDVIDLGSITVK